MQRLARAWATCARGPVCPNDSAAPSPIGGDASRPCSVTALAEVAWPPHVTVQRGLGVASGPEASARGPGAVLSPRGLSTGLAEASQHPSGPGWLGLSRGDRFTPPWRKGGTFQIS